MRPVEHYLQLVKNKKKLLNSVDPAEQDHYFREVYFRGQNYIIIGRPTVDDYYLFHNLIPQHATAGCCVQCTYNPIYLSNVGNVGLLRQASIHILFYIPLH